MEMVQSSWKLVQSRGNQEFDSAVGLDSIWVVSILAQIIKIEKSFFVVFVCKVLYSTLKGVR